MKVSGQVLPTLDGHIDIPENRGGAIRRALVCASLGLALIVGRARPAAMQGAAPSASHDWARFGWDVGRSNASTDPTGIGPDSFDSLELQQVRLEGTVDASPIYLHGVTVSGAAHDAFFVTTTYGKTIALDADDGSILWTYTPPDYDSWAGTYQSTNATPVADPDRHFIYASSPDGYIQKLAVADGGAAWRTAITVLPGRERVSASLNYFNGRVIATTGGYFDDPPYQGHVVLIDGGSGRLVKVWNSLCSHRPNLLDPRTCPESDSAIWGRAGAVVDVQTGHIFVATGNGRWNGKTYWGDATVELDAELGLVGSYTPRDTNDLDQKDLDLGSTSPVLLGDGYLLQGGKDGRIRLLSINQMRIDPPRRGGEIQVVSTPSGNGLFTAPAVAHTAHGVWVFAADDYGTAAWLFRDGRLHERWRNQRPGTSPVAAGGLLYVNNPRGGLHVYEPDSGADVATLDCRSGHWNSPIVADGRIALAEGSAADERLSGVLDIWRLPRPD
jgi:outer membrane protein assembly factor BamB